MNDDTNNDTDKTPEQWAAFQKIWGDTFTKMMQLGFTFSPESAPPDFLRQMRAGIFQGLSQAWDHFLRSPQFMEGMKQWMDNAMAFRKLSNDFMTKARHETQHTAREDIDAIMLAVRHMETRILDRVDELAAELQTARERLDQAEGKASAESPKPKPKPRPEPRRARNRRSK
jgi:hypothetical protein